MDKIIQIEIVLPPGGDTYMYGLSENGNLYFKVPEGTWIYQEGSPTLTANSK